MTSGVNSYGCCAGPMQFNLSDTWGSHKDAYRQGVRPTGDYPQRSSSHPSVYDPFDAIMAAGDKLRDQGADLNLASAGTRRAVFGYNHADWYVNEVVERARTWQARAAEFAQNARDGSGVIAAAVVVPLAARTAAHGHSRGFGSAVKLAWPIDAHTVTSPFGSRSAPCAGCSSFHEGLDLGAPEGAPVHAAADGVVVFQGTLQGYGNYLCLRHQPQLATCYAHLSRFADQPLGATVRQSTVIGYVGQTGIGTGPHLHFEVRTSGSHADPAVDPLPYLGAVSAPAGDQGDPQPGRGCPTGLPTDPVLTGGGELAWPTEGGEVIGHSNVPGSTHDPAAWPPGWQSDNALDIAVPVGTQIFAVADGRVCSGCGFGGLGSRSPQLAGLRFTLNTRGNAVYYAHLSRLAVRPGQHVRRGQLVGYSGAANGVAHLHIAVQHGSPEQLLDPRTAARTSAA